jgi:hypothetical protein
MLKGFLIQLLGFMILMQGLAFVHLWGEEINFGFRLVIAMMVMAGLDLYHWGKHMMWDSEKAKKEDKTDL